MRIAFFDHGEADFNALTIESEPLGGAHSAACYLARSLAAQGHEVFLINAVSVPGNYDGVTSIRWGQSTAEQLSSFGFEAFICLLGTPFGSQLRAHLGPRTRLILWTGHAADQLAVKYLHDAKERDVYDGIAMVSEWQRAEFQRTFGIPIARMGVMRNAFAPAFADQFDKNTTIISQKASPPVLAYTSTPYRGLELLLDAFPRVREAVPGARLRIYSSMRVYRVSPEQDQAKYGGLYKRAREMTGVEYAGALPQPLLAKAMREVSVLAYPNIFLETSCIAAIEAMASGCAVVTSGVGALPETTAGFARLIPPQNTLKRYLQLFVESTVQACREFTEKSDSLEANLRKQVKYFNANYTWDLRAREWVQWLENLEIP